MFENFAGNDMRKTVFAILLIWFLSPGLCPVNGGPVSASQQTRFISVKYRSTPVDIGHPRFSYLNTSKSSFVTGAWYDEANAYMIIGLNGTNYHYCRMPRSAWESLRKADSFGRHYNAYIKGRYDCRLGGVPEY